VQVLEKTFLLLGKDESYSGKREMPGKEGRRLLIEGRKEKMTTGASTAYKRGRRVLPVKKEGFGGGV